jgi:hypothetical protein
MRAVQYVQTPTYHSEVGGFCVGSPGADLVKVEAFDHDERVAIYQCDMTPREAIVLARALLVAASCHPDMSVRDLFKT